MIERFFINIFGPGLTFILFVLLTVAILVKILVKMFSQINK